VRGVDSEHLAWPAFVRNRTAMPALQRTTGFRRICQSRLLAGSPVPPATLPRTRGRTATLRLKLRLEHTNKRRADINGQR
jgi:hypothetical protein